MAAGPGEEVIATLFADVHYFYGPPSERPPHHRFDKGSYVYLYGNKTRRRARVEIANNPGTPDQDAFDGYLDNSRIDYDHQHSCLVSLTVEGSRSSQRSPATQDPEEWRLPTFDPHNEKKYLYKLHAVDIYFWEKEDAQQFVSAVKNFLSTNQVAVLHEPVMPTAHAEEMSPIVQKLENVAISDPSYQQSQTRDSRPSVATFPGPPSAPVTKSPEPATFAPMAYNPAAPAAPEAIRHREKTPPPPDAAANPLAVAAASEQGQHYTPGVQNSLGVVPSAIAPSSGSYFPGPPQSGGQYGLGSIPPPPQTASPASHQQAQYNPQGTFTTPHYQQSAQYAGYPGSHGSQGYQQPVQSPGFQQPLQSPSFAPPPQQASSIPSPPPALSPTSSFPGYTPGPLPQSPPATDYSIHQQLYQPTEAERAHKNKPVRQPTGKLEENAQKLEKGVTGFLKRIEKKYG